uniref:Protein phosphatase 1 regulatory subunit 21 n=1 Tax=Caenorhabditis tropicalis TaxID=1561998 RepID=A0A1I7T9Z5_9PELO
MSVSSVSLSSDVNVRYQRLAQEYTKLRAQAKVLREGVIEERGKVDKLTEDLRSKEAVIRRLEAENESLTFRNDQLVRRVETFQFEPPSSAHTKKAPPINHVDPKVELLEQELRRRLEQNERLVSEMAENERQHAIEMAEMSEKLAKEMRKLEDEVRRMRMRSSVEKKEEKKIVEEVEKKEVYLEEIGSPEPPESMEEARIMVAEATKGTFSALNNVFTLLQQRCEIYPFDATLEKLPSHVLKLSSEYAQTSRLFSSLVEITDEIITNSVFDSNDHLPGIISKCRLISQHCNQMLKELIRRMTGEENRVTWCTAALNKLNNQWELLILKLFDVFEEVTTSLETSEGLLDSLDSLDSVSGELLECFQKRWLYESQFPTTTKRIRCVGKALEAALQMTSQETSKLAARARRVHGMKEIKNSEEIRETSEDPKEPPVPEPYNPFDEDDDFRDASESHDLTITDNLPEDVASPPELPEVPEVRKDSEAVHLQSEILLLSKRNEELQKERDKLFVDNSLVRRKLEIATATQEKPDPGKTDIDQLWTIGMEKRDEWIQRVQKAEKALRFYENEFDLLLRHELASEEHLKHVSSELQTVTEKNHRLEDELESVRRSYESQLGDLSEHLATLVKDREKEKETSKSRGSLKSFFNKN